MHDRTIHDLGSPRSPAADVDSLGADGKNGTWRLVRKGIRAEQCKRSVNGAQSLPIVKGSLNEAN
eukprot:m.33515 g.33515  ORF g.33515 m.33515 type:complete len:65 (+) comp7196_c0_seq2:2405-2599(+)